MMALLRSRRTMFILAGVVIVGMVVSAGIGLFNAIGSAPVAAPPAQYQQGGGQGGSGQSRNQPPDADVLGEAPSGLRYTSDAEKDVYCEGTECVRLVRVMTEEGELPEDSRETVLAVVDHLTGQGWEEQHPQGAPAEQIFLSNGEYMLADTSAHDDPGTAPTLMLGDASGPTAP
ncbi:hypothetical protein [Nocardiopsis halotolerans]|uniref:hypothetical protein n=1 Tax=Nocardiopsis halotolerans TaxID=124252 RepID=UPI00034DE872|nr:hypothetical protein [Nocardiopsis halotolerans]